jgi:predicted RNA-binding protein with PIN domain
MSHILIDGYNLIGAVKRDMESEREALIARLLRFTHIRSHSVTIVFDGWKNGLPVETRTRKGKVTIIFSQLYETADSVIKRIISEKRKSWIVVSSDREIMHAAQENDCMYLTSQEFNIKMQETISLSIQGDYEPLDDDNTNLQPVKKGNPRKLSKKERQKRKILKKL